MPAIDLEEFSLDHAQRLALQKIYDQVKSVTARDRTTTMAEQQQLTGLLVRVARSHLKNGGDLRSEAQIERVMSLTVAAIKHAGF